MIYFPAFRSDRIDFYTVCRIVDGIGYDAFNEAHRVITDDFGGVVFI